MNDLCVFGPKWFVPLFNSMGMGPSCFVLRNKATKMRFFPLGLPFIGSIIPRDDC
ncbi:MAG: hypothetical protein Tsb002_37450 [Wenzhouxiangellaceae bacterium]